MFFIVCLLALAVLVSDGEGFSLSADQVAVLDLQGIILDAKDFTDQLKQYGNRSGVRAVVLTHQQPGRRRRRVAGGCTRRCANSVLKPARRSS